MSDLSITRRSALKLGLGAGAVGLAAPFVISSAKAASKKLVFRMSSSLPADKNASHFVWYERFNALLKEAVGDAITVNYFPNGQLGKEGDQVQQVRLGAVDMMCSGAAYWSSLAEEFDTLALGYLFDDWDHATRALSGQPGKTLSEILFKKASIHTLCYIHSLGTRSVFASKAIDKPEGMKGVKIRVLPVPNFVATLEAMGAVPIPLPLGELYTALQTGVVDGLEHDAPTVLAGKFYEVASHCSLTKHIHDPNVVVISDRAMKRIPDEHREAFLKAAEEAGAHERSQALITEANAFEELKKKGLTVSEIDREHFRKALQPVWENFAKKSPTSAPIIEGIRALASSK